MNFRTEINILESNNKIEHYHKIMTIGSCFAENIAKHLKYYRFNVLENPFGVLYNPVSILKSLELLKENKVFKEDDLFQYNSEWHSFFHHSDFSSHDVKITLNKINNQLSQTRNYIGQADYLFLTFGTAFIYKHLETEKIVSNCHKIPAKYFERRILGHGECIETINSIISVAKLINPKIKFIFTVSPVRYWVEQATDNQLSKSLLLLGINEICNTNNNCEYFAAYEIMLDELRDYRFYKSDMIHPTELAIEYIWQKFNTAYFSNNCINTTLEIKKLVQAISHKPRNINSEKHQSFIKKQLQLIATLQKKYSYLDLKKENNILLDQLNSNNINQTT